MHPTLVLQRCRCCCCTAEGDLTDNWGVLIQEEIYEIMGEEVNLYLAGVNRWHSTSNSIHSLSFRPPLQKTVHPRQPAEHRGVLPHRRRHRAHQLGHSRQHRQYIYHLPCIYPDSISISRVIVIKCFACKNNLNHDLCISNNNGRNYERDNK